MTGGIVLRKRKKNQPITVKKEFAVKVTRFEFKYQVLFNKSYFAEINSGFFCTKTHYQQGNHGTKAQ